MLIPSTQTVSVGLSQSYIGYNTIGGSFESVGGSVYRTFMKKVTLASAGLLASIDGYVRSGDGANVQTYSVAVFDDNAGAPGKALAVSGAMETTTTLRNVNVFMTTTARWLASPIGMWMTAGTYWLVVQCSDVIDIAYDAGGHDYAGTTTHTWLTDGANFAYADQSRSYSIRGNLIQ